MKDILKQRLVGAVVLIALAVIFVPMIFEAPDRQPGLQGDSLPAQPEYETPERIRPIELPVVPEPVPEVMQIEEPAPPGKVQALEDSPLPPVAQEPEPAETVVEQPEPAPVQQVPAKPTETALAGWVVQVASVKNRDNALALKDRLRQLGFDSFMEQVKTPQGLLYRVRVGPEVDRSGAETRRKSLRDKAGLNGIVLQYP